MSNPRVRFALLFVCLAGLVAVPGTVRAQGPFASLFPQAVNPEPVPLAGEPSADDLSDLLERLNAAELRIQQLESGRSVDDMLPAVPPAEDLLKSIEEDAEPEAEEEPELELKWFEKYGLRGYMQFRDTWITDVAQGSAPPQNPGDASIANDTTFILRRARLIFSGNISDHLFVYLQPDFAVTPPGSPDSNHFVQLRDWYGDVFIDEQKEFRFRVGQSKVPYGWENMQSSSNRVPFDRDDAFNSATRNERDLGVFFYYTPVWAQEMYTAIMDAGLKHSGNYGLFAFGPYVGQGGSFSEQNGQLHLVARLNVPFQFANGQYMELGVQGITGDYVVLGSPIRPLGLGAADITPAGTKTTGNPNGILDQRLGFSFIYYPQPLGFQSEWTFGRGPQLNEAQTAIDDAWLQGGYAMVLYQIKDCWGTWFPFVRYQYYEGGYRSARNAPATNINEWNFGLEWQIRKEVEITFEYDITNRTNLNAISSGAAVSSESYGQFRGQVARVQVQLNY